MNYNTYNKIKKTHKLTKNNTKKNKIIFIALLSLFCANKNLASNKIAPLESDKEKEITTKELVICVSEKIKLVTLLKKIENQKKMSKYNNKIPGKGLMGNGIRNTTFYTCKTRLINAKDKYFLAIRGVKTIIDDPNLKELSEGEKIYFNIEFKPNKKTIKKHSKINKLFKVCIISSDNQKIHKSVILPKYCDIYKDLNNIFETKYAKIDRELCLKFGNKNKFIKNLKNGCNKLIDKISIIGKKIFLTCIDPTYDFTTKDESENPIYKQITNNIIDAIKILDKNEKTLEDYLLFAKLTNNKALCRSIINSCFIVKDFKNINFPGEIVGIIISFASIESLAGEKLLV